METQRKEDFIKPLKVSVGCFPSIYCITPSRRVSGGKRGIVYCLPTATWVSRIIRLKITSLLKTRKPLECVDLRLLSSDIGKVGSDFYCSYFTARKVPYISGSQGGSITSMDVLCSVYQLGTLHLPSFIIFHSSSMERTTGVKSFVFLTLCARPYVSSSSFHLFIRIISSQPNIRISLHQTSQSTSASMSIT